MTNNLELPSNKKFGFFFSILFLIISFYLYFTGFYYLSYFLVTLSILLFLITIINDNLLLRLNKLWMMFGLFLGKIISPLVIGFIFFGLFFPIALFGKLIKRDELKLKKNLKSSWIDRETKEYLPESFNKQF